MATWPDPRAISVGFAFGHTQYEDPTGLTFEVVSPADDPDTGNDPGPVLESVTWTRGRIGDAPETSPTSIDLRMRNTDGEFSPRNVTGPRYGALREGTPMQLALDLGDSPVILATAFALGFSPTSSGPDIDPQVHVSGLGVLNRIARDVAVLSRVRLGITGSQNLTLAEYSHYWPMEDGADQFASGLPGGSPLTATGVEFSADSDLLGSLPLPVFGSASSLSAAFPGAFFSGSWNYGIYVRYPVAPVVATTLLDLSIDSGSAARVTLTANASTATLTAFNSAGGTVDTLSSATLHAILFSGEWVSLQIFGRNGTGQVNASAAVVSSSSGASIQIAITVPTVGEATSAMLPASAVLNGASLGHQFLGNSSAGPSGTEARGGDGDLARRRILEIATLAGIANDVPVGITSTIMAGSGPQTISRWLREAEDADGGVLYELRDGQLAFRPLDLRYNDDVALTLEFGTVTDPGDISNLIPGDDGRDTYNMVTVSTPSGSFALAEQTDGPVGSDPTTGIGPRAVSVTRNVQSASDLPHHAGWILRRGTIDRPRYLVVFDLYANPDRASAVVDLDIGSRIQITGAPEEDHGPDTLDLIVVGERGEIDAAKGLIFLFCEPYDIYLVGILADTAGDTDPLLGRMAGDELAAIRAAISDSATSIAFDPLCYRWTTAADDYDPDLKVRLVMAPGIDGGGELVEVSAIATTAATLVAAGAVSVADNAAVSPAIFAGAAADDWIVVVGRIRSGSAGTIAVTSGYSRVNIRGLTASSPLQVWVKKHSGSESNPTVTPTGGGAGDTVSAFTFGLRSMPIAWTDVNDAVVEANAMSNASAQDIAFPGLSVRKDNAPIDGCVVLLIGGKDDDWTSVAAVSGFTELLDSSSTTGNDQGLVVDYVIQTTATAVPHGSFTVTGGATAVSEGVAIAFAGGYQTMTVSARSVNGVVKSHAALTRVEVEDALVLAL